MPQPRTSLNGTAFLERKESVVLKAYRDVVGVWTIGAGLTKGSGVVDPEPGMVLTSSEASELLRRALARNYEPRVRAAMPNAKQHEFDAGVSFDFNTGQIHAASWVGAWKKRDWTDAERRFKMWNKGGRPRRVIQGLVNRRAAEWRLLKFGDYGPLPADGPSVAHGDFAVVTASIDDTNLEAVASGLRSLGYAPGLGDQPKRSAVEAFQRDHDLTVDGIIGPATLATVQRQVDARRKLAQSAAVGGAGGAAEATPPDMTQLPEGVGLIVLGLAALWALWLLWRYRDWLAARVQRLMPATARWLRSF